MPVIVKDLDIIKKGTDEHINKEPDNLSLYEIQKKLTLQNCLSL